MGKAIDLTGQRFGRLVALEPTEKRSHSSIVWRCQCTCGNICFVSTDSLRSNNAKSCGCLRLDNLRKKTITHGMAETRIYKIWQDMISRCENPNRIDYKYYGGRGIKVCDHWHSFENFYADVGDRPKGMTLDRRNNDGNYELSNFCWSTRKQQANNRRPRSHGPCKQRWFRAWHKNSMAQYLSNNQREFARKWGLISSSISCCLVGKCKQHRGWTFKRI